MPGFPNPISIANALECDRTSFALKTVAAAAGLVALALVAAAVGLLVQGLWPTPSKHLAITELWLFGGAVWFGVTAAAATILARISRALFELELDHEGRALFGRANHKNASAEAVRRLTSRSSALGLTEFHDPPNPMGMSSNTSIDGRHRSQAVAARGE